MGHSRHFIFYWFILIFVIGFRKVARTLEGDLASRCHLQELEGGGKVGLVNRGSRGDLRRTAELPFSAKKISVHQDRDEPVPPHLKKIGGLCVKLSFPRRGSATSVHWKRSLISSKDCRRWPYPMHKTLSGSRGPLSWENFPIASLLMRSQLPSSGKTQLCYWWMPSNRRRDKWKRKHATNSCNEEAIAFFPI